MRANVSTGARALEAGAFLKTIRMSLVLIDAARARIWRSRASDKAKIHLLDYYRIKRY